MEKELQKIEETQKVILFNVMLIVIGFWVMTSNLTAGLIISVLSLPLSMGYVLSKILRS